MTNMLFAKILQIRLRIPNRDTNSASQGPVPQECHSPVLQPSDMQARRRAKPPWGRFRTGFQRFLRKFNASAPSNDDIRQSNQPCYLHSNLPPNIQSTPTPDLFQTFHHADTSRFWAVLIGIDAYESNPLRGCVSDASLMKKLLIENMGVPEKHIQSLLGTQYPARPGNPLPPSRVNILNILHGLIDNPGIERDDNIIIYYAGHGSAYYCSQHSFIPGATCQTSACPIEALCPIDRDTMDSDGRWIPDISDRELNVLLTQISRTKGYHITFIKDCCHAISFDRTSRDSEIRTTRPTFHSDVNYMLHVADQRLGDLPGYQSVLSGDWKPDTSSHVLLAACRDYQYATETAGKGGYNGIFTKTLIGMLKSDVWREGVTYIEVTHLLNQSYSQTPIVAGDHIYDPIWYQT
ncbi:caspase domain-containing protein [Armillaria mellea]|nr:caspase domain-containing protein [Armillaria mellea]